MKSGAKMKANVELPKAIAYLEDLVKSLKAGRICITNCEKSLTLTPEPVVKLELEASQKNDKEELALRIAWRKEEAEPEETDLQIRSEGTVVVPKLEKAHSKSA